MHEPSVISARLRCAITFGLEHAGAAVKVCGGLGQPDRGGGFERDAKDDRLAVADAALHAARVVGGRAEAPVCALYTPAAQLVHTADVLAVATLPYAPTEHTVHAEDEEEDARLLYEPAVQPVHTEAPVVRAL